MDEDQVKVPETKPRLVTDILSDHAKAAAGINDLLFDLAQRVKILEDSKQ